MDKEKISFFDQRTIEWDESDSFVRFIDQTLLPEELSFVRCESVGELIKAIKTMQIRGAPALGVAGAMGVALSARAASSIDSKDRILQFVAKDAYDLKNARPTAVNLSWGVQQAIAYLKKVLSLDANVVGFPGKLVAFSKNLADQDVETNKKLSMLGQTLVPNNSSVLTHCN